MQVDIDPEKCCASGECVMAAPRIFGQNELDGIVVLLDPEPPAESGDAVRVAETLCPTAAIRVRR